jgi:hypothetical protein
MQNFFVHQLFNFDGLKSNSNFINNLFLKMNEAHFSQSWTFTQWLSTKQRGTKGNEKVAKTALKLFIMD